jgi:hypothetical protein
MLTPINIYSGGGLQAINGDGQTDAIVLPASKLLTQGTVLGQVEGTGTAVAEVQTLAKTGTVSGGTFAMVYDGETTTAISGTSTAAQVQAALEALPSIGTGGVTCSGGPVGTNDVVITFAGALAGLAQPLITLISAVTGGGSIAISRTTAGKPAGGYWDAYSDAASGSFAGLATARRILQYNCRTDSQGRIYFGTEKGAGDNGSFGRSAPAYHAGTFRGSELTGLDAAGVTDLGRLISGSTSTLTASTTHLRLS